MGLQGGRPEDPCPHPSAAGDRSPPAGSALEAAQRMTAAGWPLGSYKKDMFFLLQVLNEHKLRNNFYEMSGEVGMSCHDKLRQIEVAYIKTESNS